MFYIVNDKDDKKGEGIKNIFHVPLTPVKSWIIGNV